MSRFRLLRVVAVTALAMATVSLARAQEPAPTPAPAADPRLSRETPEGTLRLFTLGVMFANEQLLRATMIPEEPEDMKYLLQKPTGDMPSFKEAKEIAAAMNVRLLKAGDKFPLPSAKDYTIPEVDVTPERLVAVLENSPLPTRMAKAQGYWWVDARTLIAARKRAAAFVEKQAPEAQQSK